MRSPPRTKLDPASPSLSIQDSDDHQQHSPKIPQPAFVRQTASHDVPAGSPTIRRLNHPSRSSLLRFELSFWDAPRQPCATWSCCSRYVVSFAGLVVQRWGLTPAGSRSDREKVDRAGVDPQKRGNI